MYANKGGNFPTLTSGYYWTPGDYASGVTKDNTNEAETRAVAWYTGMIGGNGLKAVAGKAKNQLGYYDMSGNLREWCFSQSGLNRIRRGGVYYTSPGELQVGYLNHWPAYSALPGLGFRLARTQ